MAKKAKIKSKVYKVNYDKMPMEIEARKLSGEKQECITDYTNCVRDGRANTITDANFRV